MLRTLRYVAVAIALTGVVVGLAPTLGFTAVDAERSTSVAVADDGSALLALESTEAVVDSRDGTTAGILRNNAGQSLTVDYTVSVGTKDLTVETSDGVGVDIGDGEGIDVVLSCRPGNKQGTATLQVTVSTATGSTVSIEDAVLTRTVDYNCPPGGGGPPPGEGPAFNDADGDGVYDEGEQSYTAKQLRDFDDSNADLVVRDAGSVDTKKNADVSIEAKTVTFTGSSLDTKNGDLEIEAADGIQVRNASFDTKNGDLEIESEGDISVTDSDVTSKNGDITISAEGTLSLAGSSVRNEGADVSLSSEGDMTLTEAEIRSGGEATAELDVETATLAVGGLTVADSDETLTYSPSEVTDSGEVADGEVKSD